LVVCGVAAQLKDIDVEFPVGKFIATGVSAPARPTLVNEIVFGTREPAQPCARQAGRACERRGIDVFDKVIETPQKSIGRTPRSNPATYTDLFMHIRELYSPTRGEVRGYKRGGSRSTCAAAAARRKGDGQIKIEMHFLPDVYVRARRARARYNRETLEVRFRARRSRTCSRCRSRRRCASPRSKIRRGCRRSRRRADHIKLGQPRQRCRAAGAA
jgi:excinuclease ABC subunit A